MRIVRENTDATVLAELGTRLARTRLDRNLTQRQLADEAGVGKTTVERVEAGQPVRTPNFIRILRALGLLEALDRLVPEPVPSPIERVRLEGRRRKRAAGRRGKQQSPVAGRTWTWGDETGSDR